jgi:putative heme degradation protein
VRTFGRVVYFCVNRGATLVHRGPYPEIWTTPCGQSGWDGDRGLKFFFPGWARGFVTVEQRETGWLYAVEFQDFHGEVIHKIFLTPESNLEAFLWWLKINQASNCLSGSAREKRSFDRIDGPVPFDVRRASQLSTDTLREVLRAMIEAETQVRMSVENDGLMQSLSITSSRLREDRFSIYFGDEETGLQLRLDQLADIALHRSANPSKWRVQVCRPGGSPACAIEFALSDASKKLEFVLKDLEIWP